MCHSQRSYIWALQKRYFLECKVPYDVLILSRGTILSCFGSVEVFGYDVNELNGPDVHSLRNVMTMQKDVHDRFDHPELWFESTAGAVVRNHAVLTPLCNLDGPKQVPYKNYRFNIPCTWHGEVRLPKSRSPPIPFSGAPRPACHLCQGCPYFRCR